jgi:hypothetical protein
MVGGLGPSGQAREGERMNPSRLQRIRATFASFEPCGPALVARVLQGIEERHPFLASKLDRSDPVASNTRVWNAFARLVNALGQFRSLEKPLLALGIQAARQGIDSTDLRVFREETLRTMGELLGGDWTAQVRQDWTLVLEAVSGAMLRGVAVPAAARVPARASSASPKNQLAAANGS